MALFGYPIAQENDAERAARATKPNAQAQDPALQDRLISICTEACRSRFESVPHGAAWSSSSICTVLLATSA
jgi:hypothetical protein